MNQEMFTDLDFDQEYIWIVLKKLISERYVIDAFSFTHIKENYVIVAHQICKCGKPAIAEYLPCCSKECWSKEYEGVAEDMM